VTHLLSIASQLEIVTPSNLILEETFQTLPVETFAPIRIEFLVDLAHAIARNKQAREYQDLLAFAFWCSRKNLVRLQNEFQGTRRIGRGIILHISPSNVPLNFAYSFLAGFLAGNSNVIRLPSKLFTQVQLFAEIIDSTLKIEKFIELKNTIAFLRYGRSREINDSLSSFCDVRVIWGGDETVNEIRKSAIPPKSFDVTFTDRYSICAIDAVEFLNSIEKERIASGFFEDTYLYDQNACTAPHLIVWLGSHEDAEKAKKVFWEFVGRFIEKRYSIEPISVVNKITNYYRFVAQNGTNAMISAHGNRLNRIQLEHLDTGIEDFHANCGLFFEYTAEKFEHTIHIITRKFQTLTYYGLDPVDTAELLISKGALGIDRLVPIGQSMDFELNWDGYDLINTLSRVVSIK
jgi:hypothetical protein